MLTVLLHFDVSCKLIDYGYVMAYDKKTDSYMTEEQRRVLKEERKAANKKAWAERQKENEARMPISTPVGTKQRMQEFREQLLHAPIANTIIRKVLDIARDDEHPGQMAAMKMCMDRMLPVSLFEEKKESGKASIQITITGIGETTTIEGDVSDADIIDG